jgi:hypothetical protein
VIERAEKERKKERERKVEIMKKHRLDERKILVNGKKWTQQGKV